MTSPQAIFQHKSCLRTFPGILTLLALAPMATAGTLHVDADVTTGLNDGSSWANAYQGSNGLQLALTAAGAGDKIFVAEGLYKPTSGSSRAISFALKNNVAIYGGFIGSESSLGERPELGVAPSVLSADLSGNDGSNQYNDNSYHVVNGASRNATAILDGFTIQGGNANSGSSDNDKGGGILCLSNSNPTVRNCRFIDNRCTFGGGAGYIRSSAPSFTDCDFIDNTGGSYGGAFDIAGAGAVKFDRCHFEGNSANRAGALEIFSTSGASVTNCVFFENTSTGSGGGGALWIGSGGSTQVRNCTIMKNYSTVSSGAGLLVQGASVSAGNCIFWNNTGPGGAQASANQVSGTTVTYSIVKNGAAGAGNLSSAPSFVDPLGGDFNLNLSSPAVDAGNNALVPAGILLDKAGNLRRTDEPSVPDTGTGGAPIVDIGAFEIPMPAITSYCSGDGTGGICPCLGAGSAGAGCASASWPAGCLLTGSGRASVAYDSLMLSVSLSTPNASGVFFTGFSTANGGLGNPFGGGLLCMDEPVCRIQTVQADFFGIASSSAAISQACGILPGQTTYLQWWYPDPANSCGSGVNLSNALEVTWE